MSRWTSLLTIFGYLFCYPTTSYFKDDFAYARSARPVLKGSFSLSHSRFVALDAHRDVREDPAERLAAFDGLDASPQRFLGGMELFRAQPRRLRHSDPVFAML